MHLPAPLKILLILICLFLSSLAQAAVIPAAAIQQLNSGKPVDLIVEYDATAIEQAASDMRKKRVLHFDDSNILAYRSVQYQALKDQVDRQVNRTDIKHLLTYSHLPMSFKRFQSMDALNAFALNHSVKALYMNEKLHRVDTTSFSLVNQPQVLSVGEKGAGTTVAVIDDGIDYTNAAFGSCTSPGIPSGTCHVVASNTIVTTSGVTPGTDSSHGTNVSGIVLGMAPAANIAMINVFDNTGNAYSGDITSAINWAIANRVTYNIVAINMSLGGNTRFTSTCKSYQDWSVTPVSNATNAGITVVAASGNSAWTNGVSSPACAPQAVSVGAVYDADYGSVNYPGLCTDSSSSSDKVTCFSNTASFLSILAPGSFVTAAGVQDSGTSQATPHVAGAVAVLRSTYPNETLAQTLSRMTSTGVSVTDTRVSITKPRLDLLAAARPLNDNFSNRFTISGNSGSTKGVSLLATKETGEPNIAGNAGGSSVWWKWTAPASGQLTLDTIGSGFDTLLGVYTGSAVNVLTLIAANDNNGSPNGASGVALEVVSGKEYEIAVDGVNGAAGAVNLDWALNTNPIANLSVTLSGPTSVSIGNPTTYSLTISNAGPQTATNATAAVTFPAGTTFVSAPSSCALSGSVLTCSASSIPSGGNQSFNIVLVWNSLANGLPISVTANSDVPESTSNNTAVIQVAVLQSNNANDADTPTMPEWGMIILAGILLTINAKSQKKFKSWSRIHHP